MLLCHSELRCLSHPGENLEGQPPLWEMVGPSGSSRLLSEAIFHITPPFLKLWNKISRSFVSFKYEAVSDLGYTSSNKVWLFIGKGLVGTRLLHSHSGWSWILTRFVTLLCSAEPPPLHLKSTQSQLGCLVSPLPTPSPCEEWGRLISDVKACRPGLSLLLHCRFPLWS